MGIFLMMGGATDVREEKSWAEKKSHTGCTHWLGLSWRWWDRILSAKNSTVTPSTVSDTAARATTNMKCSSSSSMFLKASSDREKNIAKQMTNWRAKKSSTREKKAQPPIRAAFRKMSMRWKMAGRKCFVHRRATSPSQTTNAVLVNLEKKNRHLNIVLQTFARALSGCCWLFV